MSAPRDALLAGLGARIRGLRSERGLSQRALAQRAGVSPRFLVQVEQGSGNASLSRLADLAGALGVSLTTLVHGLGPVRDDLDALANDAAGMAPAARRRLRLRAAPRARKVALVGIRGAGKSTVGARLAARLGCPFVALDRRVEERAGMPLVQIFDVRGADGYREMCRAVLEDTLLAPGRAVLEVGGGLVTDPEAWRLLRERAFVAWLKARPEELLRRVQAQGDLRPMAGWADPLGEIRALQAARAPGYGQADQAVDTEASGVEGAVAAIASRVG